MKQWTQPGLCPKLFGYSGGAEPAQQAYPHDRVVPDNARRLTKVNHGDYATEVEARAHRTFLMIAHSACHSNSDGLGCAAHSALPIVRRSAIAPRISNGVGFAQTEAMAFPTKAGSTIG
jgi:hypothetical protein